MEGVEVSALKKACRPEAPQPAPWQGQENQSFVLPDDVAWAVERGGFLGEEFSVDDLLDFDGLEPDKELEKEEEEDKVDAFVAVNHKNSTSSASSAVSFEDPPLSDINLPTHDAAEFEWMSSIIDDSLLEYPPSAGVPPPYRPATHSNPQPKTRLSPPGENLCIISTEALVPVKAKRSKRPRIAGSAWPTSGATALSDSSASSSTTTTTTTTSYSSCSSSPSYSSYLVTNHVSFLFDANPPQPKKQNPKKRGRKPKSQHEQNHHHPPPHAAAGGIGGRHCTHCGAQKTPQWRTGPQGPKTLCNACGVRYKSGRLMPEYRPAASPTFVSHVHSNSHRKVLEMRRKKEEQFISAAAPPVSSF